MNLRPSGYEPDELPTALLRDKDIVAKKKIIKKLKNKYRLIIYNDGTSEEKFSLKLSLFNTYVIIGCILLLLFFLEIILVKYTPIGNFAASSDYQLKSKLYKNILLIDSLEKIQAANDEQYRRLKIILNGQDSLLFNPKDTMSPNKSTDVENEEEINYVRSKSDSLLRIMVEEEDRFNVTYGQDKQKQTLLSLYLYPPIKNGVIVASYKNSSTNKFGIDISAAKNTYVMATAQGTVISTSWSVEEGYTTIIQHDNDLTSSYKHTSELLKKVGDKVNRGEAIAILGSSTKNTKNSKLHFELWHKGKSLMPQDFISF